MRFAGTSRCAHPLLLLAVIWTPAAGFKQAPAGELEGRVVFSLREGEAADIYLLGGQGGLRRLTRDPARKTDPVWSPDGTRIAFVSKTLPDGADSLGALYTEANLFVIDPAGGSPRSLTSFPRRMMPRLGRPAWSPDGRMLAFSYEAIGDGSANIYRIAADGTGLLKLTDSNEYADRNPRWSPDGRRIVFQRWRASSPSSGQVSQLHLVDARGGAATRRLVAGARPSWSPDGRQVAFLIRGGSILVGDSFAQLALVDPETLEVRRIGPACFTISRFCWSPDGRSIALVGRREHQRGQSLNRGELELRSTESLYLLEISGVGLRRLSADRVAASALAWSPSGEQLCYAVQSGEKLSFRMVDRAGHEQATRVRDVPAGATCSWGAKTKLPATNLAGRWTGEVRIHGRVFPLELEIGERNGAPFLLQAVGPQVPGDFTGGLERSSDVFRRSIRLEQDGSSRPEVRHFATWTLRLATADRLLLEERVSPERPRSDGPAFPVYELRREVHGAQSDR